MLLSMFVYDVINQVKQSIEKINKDSDTIKVEMPKTINFYVRVFISNSGDIYVIKDGESVHTVLPLKFTIDVGITAKGLRS